MKIPQNQSVFCPNFPFEYKSNGAGHDALDSIFPNMCSPEYPDGYPPLNNLNLIINNLMTYQTFVVDM